MQTFFASAEKNSEKDLLEKLNVISGNPFVSSLVRSMSSFIAVIDEKRQVLAVNDELMKSFGWENAEEVFGLRPGELVHCIHANEVPSGCGTTVHCSTCGAAIAIVSSLEFDTSVEKTCSATSMRNGNIAELCFKVKSIPVSFNGYRFLLLFIQDITMLNTIASLEKTFFHDINNLLGGLVGTLELLVNQDPENERIGNLFAMSLRITKEIAIQKSIMDNKDDFYQQSYVNVPIAQVFKELQSIFSGHPVARNKNLELSELLANIIVTTDFTLLCRVLINMLKNAFEATPEGGIVKVWVDKKDSVILFNVWNQCFIPPNIQKRVFQRHFSTKDDFGRGVGTYSMKLLGERMLKGVVDFTSMEDSGTVFRIAIPIV